MADIRHKEINGGKYQILIPSARKSMKLAERSMLLIGPTFATLGMDAKSGMSKFSTAIMSVDSEAVDSLLMSAASISNLSFEGRDISSDESKFDIHFQDKRKDVFPVLVWCLWENVKDFLPDLEAFGQILKATFGQTLEKAQSQTNG